MEQLIMSEGLICPDCGLGSAIIVDEKQNGYPESVLLIHRLCGFRQGLRSYIGSVFDKHHVIDKNLWGLTDRQLDISVPHSAELAAKAFKEISDKIGTFFEKLTLTVTKDLPSTSCIICGGTSFEIRGSMFCCTEGHYRVYPSYFLKQLLSENNFVSKIDDNGRWEFKYHVWRTERKLPPFWLFFDSAVDHTVSAAHLILRRNPEKKHVLIIQSDGESAVLYRELVELLKKRLAKSFVILERSL